MTFPSRLSLLPVVLLLGLVGPACTSGSDDGSDAGAERSTSTTTAPEPPPESVLEDRDCPEVAVAEVAEGVGVDCHWLVVPADRADYDGTTYELAVTVLHSTSDDPEPDPVVYLSGGPGYSGGSARYWSSTPFIEDRDVIVYDQRGTGRSTPDLNCPEMEQAVLDGFAAPAPWAEEAAAVRRAAGECRDRLEEVGIDLAAFSTEESAADLADLREALGYEEWNLLGVSYGTRLAQEVMRSHPEGIRSVILDSTYPLGRNSASEVVAGGQRAFDQLAAGCAADAQCAAAHGDLTAKLDAIVARYDSEPHRSRIDLGPTDGGEVDIAVTGADVVAGLFNALYDTALIPLLPSFATALANGESGLIDQVAVQGIPFINRVSEGMAIGTSCADLAPEADAVREEDADLLAEPGHWSSLVTVLSSALCEGWPHGDVGPAFLEPVRSDLPTLVLSGTYDPITPTPGAEAVAAGLGRAQLVTFDGVGHGVWDTSECATRIALAFVAQPGEVDATCAASEGPPDFG